MKNNVMHEVSSNQQNHKKKRRKGITALAAVMALGMLSLAGVQPAVAAEPIATVDLGSAGNYSVLAGSTITNTGNTVLNGAVGLSPGISVTGLSSTLVNGLAALDAQADLGIAYSDADRRPVTATIDAQLGGQTLHAGVFDSNTGNFILDGALTLDGQNDPNSVFILRADSLTTGLNSRINLINGAQACNVFFQLDGGAILGPNSAFVGTILALDSITANANATVEGRLLSHTGAVNLNANLFAAPGCNKTFTPTPVTGTEALSNIAAAPQMLTSQAVDPAVEAFGTLGSEVVPVDIAPVAEPAAPVVEPVAEVPAAPVEAPAGNPNTGTVTPAYQPLALTGSESFVAAQPVELVAKNASSVPSMAQKSLARTGLTGFPLLITAGLVLALAGAIFLFINRHRLTKE